MKGLDQVISSKKSKLYELKKEAKDFPGDPVAKTPGSQGSIPGQGTWSHMQATKSLHAVTKRDPACQNFKKQKQNKQKTDPACNK